jgi:hypothetical protein
MSSPSSVQFQGPGPFDLPIAQRATATGSANNGVTVTFRILLDEGRTPNSISIQMTSDTARSLSAALMLEANKADGV